MSLQIAVLGSGPAGLYAAAALTDVDGVFVDVIDRLPTPFGLVRYGVAPDHLKIKSVAGTLHRILERERIRFLGNVALGVDVTLAELHEHYDAVVLATGAALDRQLGIAGEDLAGSFSATEFVAWYSGHPDISIERFSLLARTVAVIGVGNVAIDLVRILAKTAEELRSTDMTDHVLTVLSASHIEDIYLIGRRGPAHAKFTTNELRELGGLANADLVVDPNDLILDDAAQEVLKNSPAARRNLDVLADWAQRPLQGRPRQIHLKFGLSPVELVGQNQVEGLVLKPTASIEQAPAGHERLPVQMVLRAIGYRGSPSSGLPFDNDLGVIPNAAGRILREGEISPREYVAGWIKRGPTGVIGTNKGDALETVRSLLEDASSWPDRGARDPAAIIALLRDRGVEVVDKAGWDAIDRHEIERGVARGAERVKISEWHHLISTAQGNQKPTP